MFTTRTALVSTATIVLMGIASPPATASPTRENSTTRTTHAVASDATSYAYPLEALGGRTLAQYLNDYMANRLPIPGV